MTELQQKILFYTGEGYEAKEIGCKLGITASLVKWELRKFRIDFKVKNTIQLMKVLCIKGIMQQIEKEYL